MALRKLSGLNEQESEELGEFLRSMSRGSPPLSPTSPEIQKIIQSHLSWCGECQEFVSGIEEIIREDGIRGESEQEARELQENLDLAEARVEIEKAKIHHLAGSKALANELRGVVYVQIHIDQLTADWSLFLRHLGALMRYQPKG